MQMPQMGFADFHGLADIFDGSLGKSRVTRAVAYKQSVPSKGIEIVIPRHTHHSHTTAEKATDDIVLYTTIYQCHCGASFGIGLELAGKRAWIAAEAVEYL